MSNQYSAGNHFDHKDDEDEFFNPDRLNNYEIITYLTMVKANFDQSIHERNYLENIFINVFNDPLKRQILIQKLMKIISLFVKNMHTFSKIKSKVSNLELLSVS